MLQLLVLPASPPVGVGLAAAVVADKGPRPVVLHLVLQLLHLLLCVPPLVGGVLDLGPDAALLCHQLIPVQSVAQLLRIVAVLERMYQSIRKGNSKKLYLTVIRTQGLQWS